MRPRRPDLLVAGVAVALLAAGLLVQPVVFRFDVEQRVAAACLPPAVEGEPRVMTPVGERTFGFLFATPPPDPWGRPWRHRAFSTPDTGLALPVPLNPGAPDAPFVRGGPRWVIYSDGPDGVDDGGLLGRDVLLVSPALKRLMVTDVAAAAGAWLGGLVLFAWLLGRGARRRRWVLVGLLPLVLGTVAGVGRTVGRATYKAQLPTELPGLPLVIPLEGAAILSMLALLGLVAGLGWATTRREADA